MKEIALELEISRLIKRIKKRAVSFKDKADRDRRWWEEHGIPKGAVISQFWPRVFDWELEARILEETAEQLTEALEQSEPDAIAQRMLSLPNDGMEGAIENLESMASILRDELGSRLRLKESREKFLKAVKRLEEVVGEIPSLLQSEATTLDDKTLCDE